MFEKVNPSHPDKIADRIAGAIVDLAYSKSDNPKIAVEVLIGHGECNVIIETSEKILYDEVSEIVHRISPVPININLYVAPQDVHLANNQTEISCGDNGIFKGVPISEEEIKLSNLAHKIYEKFPYDGKYIIADNKVIICQSNAEYTDLEKILKENGYTDYKINPIGYWTGGFNVDSGATNRKLGSDMTRSITGGGLHGKDLSKSDVSVNIYAWIKAQKENRPIELYCAIGDKEIDGKPYSEIVNIAKNYLKENYNGSFEKFAEWGLI